MGILGPAEQFAGPFPCVWILLDVRGRRVFEFKRGSGRSLHRKSCDIIFCARHEAAYGDLIRADRPAPKSREIAMFRPILTAALAGSALALCAGAFAQPDAPSSASPRPPPSSRLTALMASTRPADTPASRRATISTNMPMASGRRTRPSRRTNPITVCSRCLMTFQRHAPRIFSMQRRAIPRARSATPIPHISI